MRILYNSKDAAHKLPFGTLTEGQTCSISVHIPRSCRTVSAFLVFLREDQSEYTRFSMERTDGTADYDIYSTRFSLGECALYFYYFRINTENESFALYREGYDQTNMEAGELWQLSVVPQEFRVPAEYFGAVMYQIFPDRFHAEGVCDTRGKLTPFWIHENKRDVPCYLPDADGVVRNCDFFGGNLAGIRAKLDYLGDLGVRVIYLNPIFKAYSNHRYDTADYHTIDELLGTEEDLRDLCEAAHARGMRVILDGVFSHTGSNSRYFDKDGVFGEGAYQTPDSLYYSWYSFQDYPDTYTSWWGIDTLPCVNEMDESYRDFIIEGENSVIAHWIRVGVDGFRLDVADELPDAFIAAIRRRLKDLKSDALLIGEVWEDASNKISYGARRRYFTDGELDSVMNYPFRNAILDYIRQQDKGERLCETVMTVAENYPREVLHTSMNMLSTHDTPRVLSLLATGQVPEEKEALAGFRMSDADKHEALMRLRAAIFLQFVLPGMPCIYYGDEIGTEGFGDPFCRSYFDWERAQGNTLRDFYVRMSAMRNTHSALRTGEVRMQYNGNGGVTVERVSESSTCRAHVNTGGPAAFDVSGQILLCERATTKEGKLLLDTYGFALEVI